MCLCYLYGMLSTTMWAIQVISCVNTHILSMCTTNKASGGFFRFGQAELLDDLVDHVRVPVNTVALHAALRFCITTHLRGGSSYYCCCCCDVCESATSR